MNNPEQAERSSGLETEISKCQTGKVQIRSKNHKNPEWAKIERIPSMVRRWYGDGTEQVRQKS